MIIIDFSQMMVSSYLAKKGGMDIGMFRHLALNKLKMYRKMFGKDFGDTVICCDSTKYWRTDIFPEYKQKRKQGRKTSSVDWNDLWDKLNTIKAEIKQFMPYKMIEVDKAEADDLIAALCQTYGDDENILIISGDKDFPQLQKFKRVQQYDPSQKLYRTCDDPISFLKEHIITGDKGDGVPNVLSDDDSLINPDKKQVRLFKAKVAAWVKQEPKYFLNKEQLKNYKRNNKLVNLDMIPSWVKADTLKQFNNNEVSDGSEMLNYFEQHDLNQMIKKIEEF